MKAPDIIYIQTNAGETLSSKWTTIPFRDFENTEYIRKDALLEWAKEKIAKGTIDEWDKGYVQCLKDLIDKLNNF